MEIREWSYDEFPGYGEEVEDAVYVPTSGDEIGVDYIRDVVYLETEATGGPEAEPGERVLLHLEIMIPTVRNRSDLFWPALVYVQGSAWMKQDVCKKIAMLGRLAEKGLVIAVVEYRHSGISAFPAQLRDARDAVRFIRLNHEKYHVDPDRIVIGGDSSGGHTAMFAGMLPDGHELDDTSRIPGVSACVNGILDLYGAVNFMIDDGFPTTLDHHRETSPEGRLMGQVDLFEHPELRRKGTVECYDQELKSCPPAMLVHGTKDRTVGSVQSTSLFRKMRSLGCDVQLYLIEGADHGGPAFWTEEMCVRYKDFIDRCNK